MMTPNDVESRTFSSVRFGGYSMEEVNGFLDELTADYTALFQENNALKAKMKFLIGKINEFQAAESRRGEEESSFHQTYASAREAADKLIASARAERDAMLAEARLEAERIRFDAQQVSEEADQRVESAQRAITSFSGGMRKLVDMQRIALDRKADEMRSLFAQEQLFLEGQLAFLDRLEQLRGSRDERTQPPVEEPPAQEPVPESGEEQTEEPFEEPAAPVSDQPEEAVTMEVDEPTRIVDISKADDKDYQF